jgi:hypothetical protein
MATKETEICLICFQEFISDYTKDHQCADDWACGACGEICNIEDGTVTNNNNYIEFTHKAELCAAQDEEETWANLPTTCADFVSHPHIVNGRGCYTCQMALASEEQGTTALMSALLDLGMTCDVHQTGGFTMCVYIKTGEESYVYANNEGFSFYCDENCEGWANYEFKESENTPQKKAQAIRESMNAAKLEALEI